MELCSYNIPSMLIKDFKKVIPPYKGKKIFRSYLLNEYSLPSSLDDFQKEIVDPEVHPFRMSKEEINKIDLLLRNAEKIGYSISKSALMRDILTCLVDQYRNKPIEVSEQKKQRFYIPKGSKKRISNLISNRNLTFELSNFIVEQYIPSGNFSSMRNQEQEDFTFKTDMYVFEVLDEIAKSYGFKKGGRAKVFRDAIQEFEKNLVQNSPKKNILKQELQNILEQYKEIEEPEVIKESLKKYLTK